MKRVLPYLGAAFVALMFPSCLEHTSTIKLNKDGSGTITEETLFSAEASAMMAQMPAGGESPVGKFSDAKKAEESAAKMGEGVTVEKAEEIKKPDGRIGGRVVYKFADINKVKFNFGGAMADAGKDMGPPGAAPDAPAKEEKPMTFTYKDGVLTLVNPEAKAKADKPAAEKGDAPDDAEEPDPQAMAMMQQMFKDMRMALKLEVADGIAESTATHVDGNVVTLIDLPFGKLIADPANMKKLEKLKDASPADAAAAFKDIPGLKIETKDEITVKVK